jgi:hypothetical protein
VVHHSVVEVLTAQMSVPGSGLHFILSIFNGKDGDIKCTTTEVKNKDICFSTKLKKLKNDFKFGVYYITLSYGKFVTYIHILEIE